MNLLKLPALEEICCEPGGVKSGYRLGFLGGFRYLRLAERTQMDLAKESEVKEITMDSWETTNNIYAPQIGLRTEAFYGDWFVNKPLSVENEMLHGYSRSAVFSFASNCGSATL